MAVLVIRQTTWCYFFFGMKILLEKALIGYKDNRIVIVIYTENRIKMASLVSK